METFEKVNQYLGTNYKSNDEICWNFISIYQHLSEDFICEFQGYVDWNRISIYQHLSEDFIREFKNKVDWCYISKYQKLSEGFIREFQDKVYWVYISKHQHLSEPFFREFKDKVNWTAMSMYQNLSEDFIREFKGYVDWYDISTYQHLSEDFIREFQDNVWWCNVSLVQKLSKPFIKEFTDRLCLSGIKNNWLYKTANFKKKQVEKTGLYECHEDYFIAYKGIRSDRYSNYNFRFKYEKGQTYETWCDCSDEENSFGFSAWTEEMAKEYCSELVVRVKIKYEDVGRVVHDGGKVRCFKMQVLD